MGGKLSLDNDCLGCKHWGIAVHRTSWISGSVFGGAKLSSIRMERDGWRTWLLPKTVIRIPPPVMLRTHYSWEAGDHFPIFYYTGLQNLRLPGCQFQSDQYSLF